MRGAGRTGAPFLYNLPMKKKRKARPKAKKAKKPSTGSGTGKYVYDPATGKIVKISDRASVASKVGKSGSAPLPCGQGACDSCPAKQGH